MSRYLLRKVKFHKNGKCKWKLKRKRYNWKNLKLHTYDSVINPAINICKFWY